SDWFDVKPEEPVQVPVKEEPVQQEVVKQDPVVEEMPVVEEDQPEELDFDIDNEEEEAVIKDNFLDDILKEAKQYSVEKGQRAEIDTTATILSELTQAQPLEPQMDPLMVPTGEDDSFDAAFAAEIEELLNEHSEEKQEEEPKEDSIPAQIQAIIDDDPSGSFFVEEEVEEGLPEENLMEDFTPLVEEMNEIEPVIATEEEPMNVKESQHDQDIMELTQKLERERIFREEVMQETKQMKLQLNEYESELNTVNHTVSRTNKVLNFVLIVLIIALFCLLAFIAYWAMVDRGIIPAASNDVMDVWMLTVVSLI
ncbi:MAG: hypothetical protein PUF50_02740, partial [Erysipelotrichaceae bacterium]|nr:hypothetical protein [Erysipelotrichaceae bacterium]